MNQRATRMSMIMAASTMTVSMSLLGAGMLVAWMPLIAAADSRPQVSAREPNASRLDASRAMPAARMQREPKWI